MRIADTAPTVSVRQLQQLVLHREQARDCPQAGSKLSAANGAQFEREHSASGGPAGSGTRVSHVGVSPGPARDRGQAIEKRPNVGCLGMVQNPTLTIYPENWYFVK